jgi:hypothetical protein
MSESITASGLMIDREMETRSREDVVCVLPHRDVQKFLIELIDQTSFRGSMLEFVLSVKQVLTAAQISNSGP